jgi:hypothetical protein
MRGVFPHSSSGANRSLTVFDQTLNLWIERYLLVRQRAKVGRA